MKDVWQLVVYGGLATVLFLPLIVSDGMFFPFITGKNFGFRIVVEITLAAWILLTLYEPACRPRFSWVLPGVGALLAVMLVANLTGEYPVRSFWSNYERMDGYVTLLHFAGYFLVLGSVLSNRTISLFGKNTTPWYAFMVTALVASVCVCFTAFQQMAGTVETTMGSRINGTLGNASYMAIYMLFNVFVALWVLLHSRHPWMRATCAALAAMFVFILLQTATRGTLVGFFSGTFLGALYIALFNTQYPRVRQVAIGVVVFVLLATGSIIAFKDTTVVQDNAVLKRLSNINLEALSLRIDIWDMSLDGIAERPVLGWGQGNYNYIFNQYYDPDISGRSEEWYDRGHNIFIDWLSVGGALGLAAYLSIWVAVAYYLLVAPHRRGGTEVFTVNERGLLIGIFAGYFIHNLVVFDNIVSYIFFAILLALLHSRVSELLPPWPQKNVSPAIIGQVATPVVLVLAAVTVYFVNVPGMQAASDIIDAYRSETPDARLEAFQRAFTRGSFATQEITEQLAQQAMRVASDNSVPQETRQAFVAETEQRLLDLMEEKPGDTRVHVFATSFYRNLGNLEKAREQNELAQQYSPGKPTIMLERGYIEYQAGNIEEMLNYFQQAYEMNPDNRRAQVPYAAGLVLTGAPESEWRAVLTHPKAQNEFFLDQLALTAANRVENFELMEAMFRARIENSPNNPQHWVSLAFTQYRQGNATTAIATLRDTAKQLPQVGPATECFIGNIEAGREPQEGC